MQGDDRGIYGSECASLMHYIEQGGTEAVPLTGDQASVLPIGPSRTRFEQ